MTEIVITSNLSYDDQQATFTTGGSLITLAPKTGVLTFQPGWYRVDRTLTITGTMTIESGEVTMTRAQLQKPPRPEPGQTRQDERRPSPAVPPDSKPPRLIRLLSWLRKPPQGRGGPPSGSPVAGL
jgi:hypothetical protein